MATFDLLASLVRVADSRSIAVSFQAVSGGAFGASKGGAIEIDNTHATGQQAKTLAHELAHETLHHMVKGPFTLSMAELEAVLSDCLAGQIVAVRTSRPGTGERGFARVRLQG